MSRIFTGLCLLLILSACAFSPAASTPLLQSINGQTWYLDVDYMAEINEQARNEIARNGREDFISRYGDIGFRLDMDMASFKIDKVGGMVINYDNFTVISQNTEQARLLVPIEGEPESLEITLTLRGDVLIFSVGAEKSVDNAETMAFRRPQAGVEPEALMAKAREAAGRYVRENYGWDESAYSIEVYPEARLDNDILSLLVVYQEDLNPSTPRGGKSFVLELDRQTLDVIRELGFQ